MEISQALLKAVKKLSQTSSTPRLDAEVLLAHILGKNREFVLTYPEKTIAKTQYTRYKKLVKRRSKREPVAYITGHKEFYGLNFKVTPDTLIPRPETEHLVELASWNIKHRALNRKNTYIVDVGTGSGNIIISLAHSMEHGTSNKISFYGTDISPKALQIAKQNSKSHKVNKKIKFWEGNLLEPILKNTICSMFHAPCSMVIAANLPYLSKKIYSSAMLDVKKFEPKSALFSKNYGLYYYENLFKQIKVLKKDYSVLHILCFMEISPEQKTKMTKLIREYFPKSRIKFTKDLAQKWRVASFET
jgi:release factor glutamine methyltransferase